MADIEALVGAMTLEEKASLTAGGDMMSTAAVERVGIPRINVTDGPNGARGPSYPGMGGPVSTCIPCGSALGATWDPVLTEQLGSVLGQEALDRGCRGLLAPTVNLHRSPLAGRNFECYSEDPFLSGKLAAGYVRGVQSTGVFATVKHFVGNDAEFERGSINSVIDERALRELYLLPFELAVKEGGALAIMTSYNRLNGRWLTEQREFLIDLLRDEWGFEGLVMTDWFAVADTVTSLGAGLDLEMPGPGKALGASVVAAVGQGTVAEADLDAAVGRLLAGFDRIGALGAPEPTVDPKPLSTDDQALLRRAAAEATVLLANDGLLPLDARSVGRIAVLGDHAAMPCVMGGGSAQVSLSPLVSPLDALRAALGDADLTYARGCEISMSATPLGQSVLPAPEGFDAVLFAGQELDGDVLEERHLNELRMMVYPTGEPPADGWSIRIRGTVVPLEGGTFDLALAQVGRARVLLDGELVLDGVTDPPPPGGTDMWGMASKDLVAEVHLAAGVPVELEVEYFQPEATIAGVRVGFRTRDDDTLMDRAIEAATGAEVAVVFVGTSGEWETEGRDRVGLALPGRQDELVRRVAEANPRTVVVVNAASPMDLSWADEVSAVLQCWFGGQEMGPALADVLTGAAEPGGRLPTSLPLHLEHNPAHDNFPGENGELRYGESVFMGYRGYEHRRIAPRFPFGHGLGYTTFELGAPMLSSGSFTPGGVLTVSVPVTNTGPRAGSEVVQCYVAPSSPRLVRPPKELKAFARVRLEPGESTVVELELDDRSFAYWDPGQADWDEISSRAFSMFGPGGGPERRPAGWQVDPGSYELLVGRSSVDLLDPVAVEIPAS